LKTKMKQRIKNQRMRKRATTMLRWRNRRKIRKAMHKNLVGRRLLMVIRRLTMTKREVKRKRKSIAKMETRKKKFSSLRLSIVQSVTLTSYP